MAVQEVALRKRQQIAKANRTMFLWVAGVSAIVGFAIVVAILLGQKLIYNEKVLAEKSKTASVLTQNLEAIKELEEKVRVLNTNQALRDSMADGEGEPLRVVLDALPSEPNSSALGASLQERFLNESGLTVESLVVDPISGVEAGVGEGEDVQDASAAAEETTTSSVASEISFSFTVSAASDNTNALQELLQRLERSIRTINVTSIKLEQQGSSLQMVVTGRAYYSPVVTAELKDKKVEK